MLAQRVLFLAQSVPGIISVAAGVAVGITHSRAVAQEVIAQRGSNIEQPTSRHGHSLIYAGQPARGVIAKGREVIVGVGHTRAVAIFIVAEAGGEGSVGIGIAAAGNHPARFVAFGVLPHVVGANRSDDGLDGIVVAGAADQGRAARSRASIAGHALDTVEGVITAIGVVAQWVYRTQQQPFGVVEAVRVLYTRTIEVARIVGLTSGGRSWADGIRNGTACRVISHRGDDAVGVGHTLQIVGVVVAMAGNEDITYVLLSIYSNWFSIVDLMLFAASCTYLLLSY